MSLAEAPKSVSLPLPPKAVARIWSLPPAPANSVSLPVPPRKRNVTMAPAVAKRSVSLAPLPRNSKTSTWVCSMILTALVATMLPPMS